MRQTAARWYTHAMPAQPSDGYDAAYGRAARRFLAWARNQHPAVWRQYLDTELSSRPPRARPDRPEPTAPTEPVGTIDERRAAFQADQEAKHKAKKDAQRQEVLADNGAARRRAANLALLAKEREELDQKLRDIREDNVRRAAHYAAERGEH